MKKLILLSFILSVTLLSTNTKADAQTADTTITDTLAYLKQFIVNKQKYIGKPFSVLHKDLKISIVGCLGASSRYMNQEGTTTFWFGKRPQAGQLTPTNLMIEWESKPFHDLFLSKMLSKNGRWTARADSLYNSNTYIIKDIFIEHY